MQLYVFFCAISSHGDWFEIIEGRILFGFSKLQIFVCESNPCNLLSSTKHRQHTKLLPMNLTTAILDIVKYKIMQKSNSSLKFAKNIASFIDVQHDNQDGE